MSRAGTQGGFGVGNISPAAQVPLAAIGTTIAEQIDMNYLGNCVTLLCANLKYASVQTAVVDASYASAVLTIKGTLNGDNWVSLGEPTVTANGIYGPLYIAGLVRVRIEVTTVAGSSKLLRATWRGWGDING